MKESIRDKFRKQAKELVERQQLQSETADIGGSFATVFMKDKVPKGMRFWNCKNSEHIIDTIPFESGKQNPIPSADPKAKMPMPEGKLSYVVDYWIHRNIGPQSLSFVCQKNTWGKRCPVCEYIMRNVGVLSEKERKSMSPSRRVAYLVWVHDTPKDEEMGVQIFEVSHFLFEKKLDAQAKNPRGIGGFVKFWDIDDGKNIVFEKSGAGEKTEYAGHKFFDRDAPIPDEILAQSFPLDSVINMYPSTEEMEEALAAGAEVMPTKSTQRAIDKEPETDIDDSKWTKNTQEEPEPQPEEEEEKEEEEPSECPYEGGEYGVTYSEFEECLECELAEECEAESVQKKAKAKPKAQPKEQPSRFRRR